MRRATIILSLLIGLVLSGCGHVETYTKPDLSPSSKTGILYYPPKPYLLVSRTGAKDKPNDVQVIYLPDLSQPRYAVMSAGFGSSKLGLTFSNGILVSANQETDPKITEAITALAGIPGQLATAAKTRAEAADIREEASDLPAVAKALREVSADLTAIAQERGVASILNPSQLAGLRRLPPQLDDAAAALDAPGTNASTVEAVIAALEDIKKRLTAIKPGTEDPGEAAKPVWARIRAAEAKLDVTITDLKPKPEAPPTLSLYEVIMDENGTSLRAVPMSTLTNRGAQD